MSSLFPIYDQHVYPGVGDVDDCAVIGTFWAARASGFGGALPTVAEFRAAAGVPDRPGLPDGLTNAQVWAGVSASTLGTLGAVLAGPDWLPFVAQLLAGWSATVQVDSRLLPIDVRFGFLGIHRVGIVRDAAGRFWIANPLAKQGSAPLPIGELALHSAMGATVRAVLFPPQEGPMNIAVVTDIMRPAAPRTFRFMNGTLNGYDPAKPGVVVLSKTWTTSFSAHFDAVVGIAQSPVPSVVPHGGPFLHVSDGFYAGLYVVAALVSANLAPDPLDVKRHVTVTVDDGRPPVVLEV